jgi:hypothetical protein
MEAHAQAPKGGALTASNVGPKDAFDTIAEAVPIGEELSIKKERKAKSAARYLLNNVFYSHATSTKHSPSAVCLGKTPTN